jgi:hypothetical protein
MVKIGPDSQACSFLVEHAVSHNQALTLSHWPCTVAWSSLVMCSFASLRRDYFCYTMGRDVAEFCNDERVPLSTTQHSTVWILHQIADQLIRDKQWTQAEE